MLELMELRPGWMGLRLPDLASCPPQLALPSPRCLVFVACDARGYDGVALVEFGQRLLALGAVYFCAWGPDCSRVEACFDEAIVEAEVEHGDDDCIVTTPHAGESLEQALWFFEYCARPADAYAASATTRLVLAVDRPDVLAMARAPAVPVGS